MADRIVKVDDLDGSDATETVTFAIDGTDYLIDLSDKNAAELREFLKRYVLAGRRASPPLKQHKRGSRPQNMQLDMIRFWANQRGIEVSDKGRIPNHIVEAYRHAHPNS